MSSSLHNLNMFLFSFTKAENSVVTIENNGNGEKFNRRDLFGNIAYYE